MAKRVSFSQTNVAKEHSVKTPAHAANYITADSKSPASSNVPKDIVIDLADDFLEVRGFGQPIPISLAKKMAKTYCDSFEEIQKVLSFIRDNENGKFRAIHEDAERRSQFEKLQIMMDPANHIVSGVFGKEIILQILSQKNCEGIRYIVGRDDDKKMTIILAGVKETEYKDEAKNFTYKKYKGKKIRVRNSEILPSNSYIKKIKPGAQSVSKSPPIGEVHSSSLTVEELDALLGTDPKRDVTKVLFG